MSMRWTPIWEKKSSLATRISILTNMSIGKIVGPEVWRPLMRFILVLGFWSDLIIIPLPGIETCYSSSFTIIWRIWSSKNCRLCHISQPKTMIFLPKTFIKCLISQDDRRIIAPDKILRFNLCNFLMGISEI